MVALLQSRWCSPGRTKDKGGGKGLVATTNRPLPAWTSASVHPVRGLGTKSAEAGAEAQSTKLKQCRQESTTLACCEHTMSWKGHWMDRAIPAHCRTRRKDRGQTPGSCHVCGHPPLAAKPFHCLCPQHLVNSGTLPTSAGPATIPRNLAEGRWRSATRPAGHTLKETRHGTIFVAHRREHVCLDQNRHGVRSGKTLSSTAAYHDTAIDAIVFRTGLTGEHFIHVGQVLRVPGGSHGAAAAGSGCCTPHVIPPEDA